MCLHGFVYYKAMQLFVYLSNKAQFNYLYILFPVLSSWVSVIFSSFSLQRLIWTGSILGTQLCHSTICKRDPQVTLQIREDVNSLTGLPGEYYDYLLFKYELNQQIHSKSEQCNNRRMEGEWKARSAHSLWVSQHAIGFSWLSWRGQGPLFFQTVCDKALYLMYIVSVL